MWCFLFCHTYVASLFFLEFKVFVFIGDDRYKQTWVLPKNIDKPKRAKDPTKWVDQFLSQAPDIEDLVEDLAGALSECALGDRLQNQNEFYDYIKQRVADASDVQYAAGGAARWRMFRLPSSST